MFEYFDIHSHLYFEDYDNDRNEEIKKLESSGIGTISVGTDINSSEKAIELALKSPNLFACVGQHPDALDSESVFDEELEGLAENKKVVAIGECGLDYFRISPDDSEIKSIQKTVFEYHIDLAMSVGKPLMLHIRGSKGSLDAYEESLSILEHHYRISGDKLRGNAHFFAGDMQILQRFLAIGFSVSFTGVITFTNDYNDLVKYTPNDMIFSETDAPFVAPVPYRGKRNSPLYVPEVVKRMAEIKNMPLDSLKKAIMENVNDTFLKVA